LTVNNFCRISSQRYGFTVLVSQFDWQNKTFVANSDASRVFQWCWSAQLDFRSGASSSYFERFRVVQTVVRVNGNYDRVVNFSVVVVRQVKFTASKNCFQIFTFSRCKRSCKPLGLPKFLR
jgi:hypothetical protein